jgi:hypothetical protein
MPARTCNTQAQPTAHLHVQGVLPPTHPPGCRWRPLAAQGCDAGTSSGPAPPAPPPAGFEWPRCAPAWPATAGPRVRARPTARPWSSRRHRWRRLQEPWQRQRPGCQVAGHHQHQHQNQHLHRQQRQRRALGRWGPPEWSRPPRPAPRECPPPWGGARSARAQPTITGGAGNRAGFGDTAAEGAEYKNARAVADKQVPKRKAHTRSNTQPRNKKHSHGDAPSHPHPCHPPRTGAHIHGPQADTRACTHPHAHTHTVARSASSRASS